MPEAGGFVADNQNGGVIKDSYSTGLVIGVGGTLGGFCAANLGAITDCFWDTDTSGILISDGGSPELTIDMKVWVIFLIAYWCDNISGVYDIWNINPLCNDGYPCLLNTTISCPTVLVLDVETDPATSILAHSATLNGDLLDLGGELFALVYFEYGLVSGGPYTDLTTIQVFLSVGIFHADIAHLLANTTYYFRAVANNMSDIAYGIELSFKTLVPSVLPPVITLGSLANIGGEDLETKTNSRDLTLARPNMVVTLKPKEEDYE